MQNCYARVILWLKPRMSTDQITIATCEARRIDVDRYEAVGQRGLCEKNGDFVAVRRRPVIQINHLCSSGGSSGIPCSLSSAMQTSSSRGMARIFARRERARAFRSQG